jgi:cytochrome c oxidase subunit II
MTVRGRRRTRRLAGILGVVTFIFLTACAKDAPQDTLTNLGGPYAREQLSLFKLVFWVATVVFFLVEGVLVYTTIRFRRRDDREVPVQVHGNKTLEIAWTIAPALLLAILAVPTLGTIFSLAEEPKGADVIHVEIVGHQWWWEYRYTDADTGFITANELHIPTGRDVAIRLTAVDVIHSFWIPPLAGKQDVIPGRVNTLKIKADTEGTFLGQCAEYCGLSHANMRLRVMAESPTKFAEWVANQKKDAKVKPTDALASKGAAVFAKTCIACHNIRGFPAGENKLGPDLTHFADRTTFAGATFEVTIENLLKWVTNSPSMKPGSDMPAAAVLGLTTEDVNAVVAFLQTLR